MDTEDAAGISLGRPAPSPKRFARADAQDDGPFLQAFDCLCEFPVFRQLLGGINHGRGGIQQVHA